MTTEQNETLNIVQQVLRFTLIALAAGSRADLALIGGLLEEAAANPELMPEARQMLADLAAGATTLGAGNVTRQ